MDENIILLADSYKTTHHLMYPPGLTTMHCYFESRGGKYPATCFFGLQHLLKKYLVGEVVTKKGIEEAREFFELQLDATNVFNEEGWTHILKEHGGRLPIVIKAVPEGMIVPTKQVLFTVENTDPKVPWLATYVETLLSQIWYPTTVATGSRFQKEVIKEYLTETADSIENLEFKLHDFGFRGVSSVESAAISGAAHLVNFRTSDTIPGILMARKYYGCHLAGTSIAANEHSAVISWGRTGEADACRHLLEQFPAGIVSGVSDSYDLYKLISEQWCGELKPLISARNGKGQFIVRPDSGDPAEVVLKILTILEKNFGSSVNSKGFKMLPDFIRVLQGDSVCYESLKDVLERLKTNKWSAENVSFGSGGALLQRLDRDTQKCAYKLSYIEKGSGNGISVYKQPVTDPGKTSKKGRLKLIKKGGLFYTLEDGKLDDAEDLLQTVFLNGKLMIEQTFEEIRKRANGALPIQAMHPPSKTK